MVNLNNEIMNLLVRHSVILLLVIGNLFFGGYGLKAIPYQDITHHSKVFGKEKTYRLYLPDNYQASGKKYPVIYFFHGWGGRYFKDDNAKVEYEKLGELVNKYQVMLVMWDGSMDESDPRPYNIGNHHEVKYKVQMKDYFPELVNHIDSTCRTLTDRGHRGIIGFSMGGIMSYYLAGKYPDKVSAAVNMVGSTEFFIGLPSNHTLYQVKYTFDNLRDVGLLSHNRDICPMTGLNDEVYTGAIWSELKDYEFHKMEGGHKIDDPGETKVFESAMQFIINHFEKPLSLQKAWSHYDLCPEFFLWGYSVKRAQKEPGFLFLRNVDANGFGFYTKKWLPEGPAIKNCKATISTAPIYEPGERYEISIYKKMEDKLSRFEIPADQDGRLHFELTGEGCEIGIAKKGQPAGFVPVAYQLNGDRKFIQIKEQDGISVSFLNRGGSTGAQGKLKVILSCTDSSVHIASPVQTISLKEEQSIFKTNPFKIYCDKIPPSDGSPEWLRMKVNMDYDTLHWEDHFLLPVFYHVPYFANLKVDDGRVVAATKKQSDFSKGEIDSIYGMGNGDGIVIPGEHIMVYENGHRLRLFTDDPYVVTADERLIDEILPAFWPDGYTLSSVVKIADNCPAGHIIEFLAHYETKTHMPIHRQVQWGKVKIVVN